MNVVHHRAFAPIALFGAFMLVAGSAQAAERDGVKLPDTQKVDGKTLVLNGIGIREATIFNVSVYFAGLYLEKKTNKPKAIINGGTKRILMRFVRDVDKDSIVDAYQDGFENNAKDKMKGLQKRVDQLKSYMAAMKDGDMMSVTYIPGKGTFTEVKGKPKGPIPGDDFAKVLFMIFFGEDPPNSDLKKGMLGLIKD